MNQAPAAPGPSGLYDPTNERDACGVALVAKLWGEATHAVIEKGLEALGNLEHRGAAGADPNTGDGAGILLQIPDAFFRGVAAGVELPPSGRYAVGVVFLPTEHERRAQLEQLIEDTVHAEGQRVIWWRDVPDRRPLRGRHRAGLTAVHPAGADRCRRRRSRSGRVRAQAVRDPPADRARGRRRARDRELLLAHDRLQGHAHRAAAAALLHRPARPAAREPSRARPLALQHQHLPELGARAPVPDDRPQRRDQHAARQRQLDARARVAARLGAVRRRPGADHAGHPAGRIRLGVPSTTCSSCWC